jgi:predicted patatin/cPLA2 family phospholipase
VAVAEVPHPGASGHAATAFWDDNHPVLHELRRRREIGSTPRGRRESAESLKVGLAVEGGGMRGVTSAAMLTALEDLGLTRAFDAIYGSSCGAINAAYFLAGDCWFPLNIYLDDLPTKRFLDFGRRFAGKPVMDLDYAFDEILDRRKPLDYEKVLRSEVRLGVAITAVDMQKTVVVSDFHDGRDLRDALRASSWLPWAVPGAATFRGERALDGGVLTAHPHTLAAADGCTHILSLSTHALFAPRRYNPLALKYAVRYLDRIRPGLGEGYLESLRVNGDDLVRLERAMTQPSPDPYILDLGPLPGAPHVKRHEKQRDTILQAARYGYELMYSAIERQPPPVGISDLRALPRLVVRPQSLS